MVRVTFNNYRDAHKILMINFDRIGFFETISYMKILFKKKRSKIEITNDNIDKLISCIKTDFLKETNGDIEAFNLINKIYLNWINSIIEKKKKIKPVDILSFKESLIDENIGNIKELTEKHHSKSKRNIEKRFHLILFGFIILHDMVFESGDKHFEFYIKGRSNKKQRKELLKRYFKINELVESKNGILISDYSYYRNQIVHGKFTTNRKEQIFIYKNSNKDDYIKLKYQDIIDYYNNILTKWSYMRNLFSFHRYIQHLKYDNKTIKK